MYDDVSLTPLGQQEVQLLKQLVTILRGQTTVSGGAIAPAGSNFAIPAYNSVEFTYVSGGAADDDLIATQVFKQNGATVSTLTFAYVGSTNNIESITQS